ncbi:MAG: hypothetical protein QG574_2212 [Cyanobacteriota bacterium erpe_2018_sw_21hr_WHONDRS-SW48-000092_B_bin.40]|nr:hypothetical protein [Cyanobacteriota bacterium erpe_2018_sw_21hr_WHONDRS-SW48-000092_B_bin.40]
MLMQSEGTKDSDSRRSKAERENRKGLPSCSTQHNHAKRMRVAQSHDDL